MDKIYLNRNKFIQIFISSGLIIFYSGVFRDLYIAFGLVSIGSAKFISYFFLYGGVALICGMFLIQIWVPIKSARKLRNTIGVGDWLLVLMLAGIVSVFFIYSKWSYSFTGIYVRLFIFGATIFVSSWLTTTNENKIIEVDKLLGTIIILGSVFSFTHVLNTVVSFPFSLSWSEGNRLWDHSIFYGRDRYIFPLDTPIPVYTDRMRQSLWGLVYLVPNAQIWLVRLWSALVWSIPYAVLGWMYLGLNKQRSRGWIFFGLWVYLFLDQGPIYTPLVLAAILVAGSRRMPAIPAFFLVGLAGYYAREGRYTWLFAPAIWAAVIAFLQNYGSEKLMTARSWMKQRWSRATLLGVGGIVGCYFAPMLVHAIQGVKSAKVLTIAGISSTVGRQPLLWDRLLPNPTNPQGIGLQLFLATGPLIMLLVFLLVTRRWKLDRLQRLAMAGSLLAFLAVGIVASVKIGGGNNLHNLDMFLIGMVFAAALAWEAGLQDWVVQPGFSPWWAKLLLLAAVIIPAGQGMLTTTPLGAPDMQKAEALLADMQQPIADAARKGEVLFLDQRQLLTFGNFKGIPLVPDYEKKLLMDEALSGDEQYFTKFNTDMNNHRFSLIVSEPLWITFSGDENVFGNENDAWVKWVSVPILCNYEPIITDQQIGVQLLVPKERSSPDPRVSCP